MYAVQGTSPQSALEEIATTTEPEVLARHLPETVHKSIEQLPKVKKQAIMDQLMQLKDSKLGNCTVRPARDSDGWEIVDENDDVTGKVRLDNAFISGLDAMLPLRIESDGSTHTFIVGMHLEDQEWRIDNFGPWQKADLGLEELLHEPTEMEKNEAAARATLKEIQQAALDFFYTHPNAGFPSSLKQMTEASRPPQVDEQQAGQETSDEPSQGQAAQSLLDESYAADPLIKNGYSFRYLNTGFPSGQQDSFGTFEVIAVPVEYGKTGTKSYFLNQNGVMHATTENRPATEQDPFANEKDEEIVVVD